MKEKNLKFITGVISFLLLISLVVKLFYVPGGMILSGLFLGGIILVAILLSCLIVTALLRLVLKIFSFLTLYSIITALSFLVFHYKLYSPTLRITVPEDFTGKVTLVLSNVDDNVLKVDSNGIGYINQWTFDKTYTEPIVVETTGKNINERCVGFNPSTFWGEGKACCIDKKQIYTLSFEIVPLSKLGQKQYYSRDLVVLVDTTLVLAIKPDSYTKIQTETFEVELEKK